MERVIASNDRGIQGHLDLVRLALQPLAELARPPGATLPGSVVTKHLSIAIAELTSIDQQILAPTLVDSHQPPDAGRVACSFCGKAMMPAATLCGFCWRRPSEPAAAGATTQK